MDSPTTSYSTTSAMGRFNPTECICTIALVRYVWATQTGAQKEQLSTRVGCGRVHRIIENNLDKCRVVAPNLPMKTDDLSHSTGCGWTIREKDVNR
uniref:Uncharacterized protein n=1 Tax=Oryza glaberrima TaxID=4538 RepID=I1PT16_ORYGL